MSPETQDPLADALRSAHPDAPIPTGLETRLLRRLTPEAPRPTRKIVLGLVTAGVLAAVVLPTTPLFRPKRALALERMAAAFRKVKTIHVIEYNLTGKPEKDLNGTLKLGEKWSSNGRVREDFTINKKIASTFLYPGNKKFIYIYPAGKTFREESFDSDPPSPVKSLTNILQSTERNGLAYTVENLGTKQIDKRTAQIIKISLPKSSYHYNVNSPAGDLSYTFYIDPSTDLPFRIETWRTEPTPRNTIRLMEKIGTPVAPTQSFLSTQYVFFDEKIPDSIFKPNLEGFVRENPKSAYFKEWEKSIVHATRKRPSSGGFALLHLDVVEALGIMAWFTTDGDARPAVTLAGKGGDCPLLAQGTVGESDLSLATRYTVDGKRLQWAFFRQSFVAPMGNGDWKLSVKLNEKTQKLKPIVDSLGGGGLPQCEPSEEIRKLYPKLAGERCRDRAEYFLDGRWKADGPLVAMSLVRQFNTNQQALTWFQQAIKEDGDKLPHAKDWRRMADCYDALDRPEEAKTFREKAAREDGK